jgi:hypothetical protein
VLLPIAKGLALPQNSGLRSAESMMIDVHRRNIMHNLHLDNEAALAEYSRRAGTD